MNEDKAPQNLEAEAAVLGSVLFDNAALAQVTAILKPADFYLASHGKIVAAMLDLANRQQPIDVLVLNDLLKAKGELEAVGGAAYLTQLAESTPTAVNAVHYARLVKDSAMSRAVLAIAKDAENKVYLREPLGGIISGIDNSIRSLKEGIGKETNWHPLSAAEILTLSAPEIPWLWQGLIPIGCLFLLCAFMKVGKTTLAYRLAIAIAQGLTCLDRATTKTGVLILAVEEHFRDIRRRLERFGMTPEMEIYIITDRNQARDLDKIREFVKAKDIGLILIDSLSRWWDVAEENNNMEVLRAVSPLLDLAHDDSLGVAIGLIVHERKSGGEDGRGIRGGSSLFGLVDQAIILDRRPGEVSNKRLLKTLGRYEDSPKEIIIELVGDDYSVLGTPEQEGFTQAVSKVRDALAAKPGKTIEPMDVKTLAAETGLTQKMVRRALESMGEEIKESGAGVKNDPHTYSLLSQYSPTGKETNPKGASWTFEM